MFLGILLMTLAPSVRAILGQPVPEWPARPAERWVQGGPLALADLRGKVVLIRFFTDPDCPYCSATAPSLNEFQREFGPRGLVVIGIYTPKPRPRSVSRAEVQSRVKAYGFEFPVVIDEDWAALRRLWLDRVAGAEFTSASLVLDRAGVLRHVQPGGAYARDARDAQTREDYEEIRKQILVLLSEP